MNHAPPTIFQYQPLTLQTVLNLKKQCIYFGSPSKFNDPFDCALTPRFKLPTEIEASSILACAIAGQAPGHFDSRELRDMSSSEVSRIVIGCAAEIIKDQSHLFYNVRGMSCFSECNDNMLMWSHYAGQHTGFCLEFDTRFEPLQKLRKVRYSETIPEIDIAELLLNKNYELVMDLFCTKSLDWAYEREWRATHAESGTLYCYKADALKAVYFGARVPRQELDLICTIVQGQAPKVIFYQGSRSEAEFKIEFTPFTFTSFAEAQKLGLR